MQRIQELISNDSGQGRPVRSVLFALCIGMLGVMLVSSVAQARTTRLHESSFDVAKEEPRALAVDQASGDVYVVQGSAGNLQSVARFDATGAPKNFTAGPGAGTNEISGFATVKIAIDNSGGPLNGSFYVTDTPCGLCPRQVHVFSSTGASLGALTGTSNPSGEFGEQFDISIDQSNGSVYLLEYVVGSNNVRMSRYAVASPAGAITDADYVVSGLTIVNVGGGANPNSLAANAGLVYLGSPTGFGRKPIVQRFASSSFASNYPLVAGTPMAGEIVANRPLDQLSDLLVDSRNGDVYVDEESRISVFDPDFNPLYGFGFRADIGANSRAIGLKSSATGPAAKVYVGNSDRNAEGVAVFGGLTKAAVLTRSKLAELGPDGTPGTSFGGSNWRASLAFDQAARRFYAAVAPDAELSTPSAIHGFDVSTPGTFSPLGGFPSLAAAPLRTQNAEGVLSVDGSGVAPSGNVYLSTPSTNLLYGWDPSGAALGGGFPVDPAISPGAPNGSPKQLCASAVDSDGHVWVANARTERVIEYDSSGNPLAGAVDVSAVAGSPEPCASGLAFDSADNLYISFNFQASGVWKYTAASGYASGVEIVRRNVSKIAVDPSTDHLYTINSEGGSESWLDEFDSAGNLVDEFPLKGFPSGIAIDGDTGNVYLSTTQNAHVQVYGSGVPLPDISARSASALANESATLNGIVISQGVAVDDCHFEYVSEAAFRLAGFSDLSSGGSVACTPAAGSIPLDVDEHPVSATATGLTENSSYRFRLIASNTHGTSATSDVVFQATGRPEVETTGSPVRTATTARLDARVNPSNAPATYHFEYGSEGPCDSSPCEATDPQPAGEGGTVGLVSQWVEGLQPDTTYHYRVVADNGNVAGSRVGQDMTLSTRASDAQLSHGHFPGPPGSDRAYEQVSVPDAGGNPVRAVLGIADDGNRVIYRVHGGNPLSNSGNTNNQLFAERTASGWSSKSLSPPRDELVASAWSALWGRSDLSDVASLNNENGVGQLALFRLSPDGTASKIFQIGWSELDGVPTFILSDDGSRAILAANNAIYDITSGSATRVDELPGGGFAQCSHFQNTRPPHWLSADGDRVFFDGTATGGCSGVRQVYVRDIDAALSKRVSPPPLSGPDCGAEFISSSPDAVFFATKSRLAGSDTETSCGGSSSADQDVYRYELGSESVECLTCVVAGLDADVEGGSPAATTFTTPITISEDGSRVYFNSPNKLLPGAEAGLYRLDVASGDLAFVAPEVSLGFGLGSGRAISPDGSTLVFVSDKLSLNAVGGQQNGALPQFYRYEDDDRSLVCMSCPRDGSVAAYGVKAGLLGDTTEAGPNMTPLSEDGATVAFVTPNALAAGDQNTVSAGENPRGGADVYEWRDGRVLLVSDGLTNWPGRGQFLEVNGVSRSGRDIYFAAPIQYTPDALDGYTRVYDARIGGGFEFPPPPKPCPLEVCQGTPKGAPEEAAPGSSSFSGVGNKQRVAPKKTKKKKAHKKRANTRKAHKKKQHGKRQQRANHDRRATR